MFLLNVGGTAKGRDISARYRDYDQMILDIVDGPGVDIVADARELHGKEEYFLTFDAVLCSHMIEHVDAWEVNSIVCGLYNVLKMDGFAEVRTPNIITCAEKLLETGDLNAIAYQSAAGPVTLHDLIYGYPGHIVGNPFQRHLTGFTPKSLGEALGRCFHKVIVGVGRYEVRAFAFKGEPFEEDPKVLFSLD